MLDNNLMNFIVINCDYFGEILSQKSLRISRLDLVRLGGNAWKKAEEGQQKRRQHRGKSRLECSGKRARKGQAGWSRLAYENWESVPGNAGTACAIAPSMRGADLTKI